MWHPPERIRHPLPAVRSPTEAESAASRWFSPLAVGRLSLPERTWVPAMVPWRATEEDFVTDEVLDWYGPPRARPSRRCCFTNYCEGLDQMHKQVTCKLWDRVDLDRPGVKLSVDGKRR